MLRERDRNILEHIIKYCDQIAGTVAMFDGTLSTLKTNYVYKNAVSMCVLQIGELTGHLTTEFRNANSAIPWKEIRELRNLAAHQYERITIEKLYDTIMIDIPELKKYCQELLLALPKSNE